ncbi:MAG: hypothetical protein WC343_14010 [Bacilli bacterium]|jgi:hypothetical protein
MGDLQNNGINRLGELFNEYHREHLKATQESPQMVDVTLTVRVRLYGSDAHKQAHWDRDWRSNHPEWGHVQWCSVSSTPPEIWGDLRETKDGEIVINRLALGHELSHALKLLDARILDPDKDVKL